MAVPADHRLPLRRVAARGVHWALARLPPDHRAALAHARQLYLNCPYSEERWSDALRAQVRPQVDRMLAEIDRLSDGIAR